MIKYRVTKNFENVIASLPSPKEGDILTLQGDSLYNESGFVVCGMGSFAQLFHTEKCEEE